MYPYFDTGVSFGEVALSGARRQSKSLDFNVLEEWIYLLFSCPSGKHNPFASSAWISSSNLNIGFRHICLVGWELRKNEAAKGGIKENASGFCDNWIKDA